MALPDLSRLLPALLSAAQNEAPAVADAVRQYVPVSPRGSGNGRALGTAAASLYSEVQQTPDGVSIGVYSDDPVVGMLLEGTPPHTITATHSLPDGRLGYLVFEATDGGIVFTHSVNHPGTGATRFDIAAKPDTDAIVDRILDQAMQAVFA